MTGIRTINDITINRLNEDTCMFINSLNDAHFNLTNLGVSYTDPFDNFMISSPHNLFVDDRYYLFENVGDHITKLDGTMVILLTKQEIQEIANKTFYAEGQFHTIDFLNFIITEIY
jgi:hypothetical protein